MDALGNLATGEGHGINFALFVDLNLQPLRQGIDHRGAHAMETAGNLIASAAELAAGVEHGEDHFQGALSGLLLNIHRDAAAVIGDGNHVPFFDADLNVGAEASQGLVDGVIHNFINQVVQAGGRGGADIHARPLAHRFQTFQNLNL